jgi:hypothetical protein
MLMIGQSCGAGHEPSRNRLAGKGIWPKAPYVTVLPNPDYEGRRIPVAIGWKQSNNGTTFIASEFGMPWLGTDFVEERTVPSGQS